MLPAGRPTGAWAVGRRPGAWAVGQPTLHGGPVRLRPVRATPCLHQPSVLHPQKKKYTFRCCCFKSLSPLNLYFFNIGMLLWKPLRRYCRIRYRFQNPMEFHVFSLQIVSSFILREIQWNSMQSPWNSMGSHAVSIKFSYVLVNVKLLQKTSCSRVS